MSATTDTERLRDGWEGSTPSSDTLLLAGFRAMMAPGEAVSWAATLTAPALPAILLASDLGRPIYQRMGYLPLCRATMWTGER
jgi:hypothetical protein